MMQAAMRRWAPALADLGLPQFLALALVLRLATMTFVTPIHADEVFQYLETAHRLIWGQGVVSWEWREGVRGWLLPLLAVPPMALGGAISLQNGLHILLPNLAMALASLTVVAVAWRLGARVSRLHAQFAAFAAAVWYEFIYFAPHVMSESAATLLILPAAVLLIDRELWSFPRLALAAALLANAAAIRFQYAPAIAALVVAACYFDLRRAWLPLLIGGLVGLVPSVLADLAMGATPFAWVLENFHANIEQGRAAGFSSSGPAGYLPEIWPRWILWSVMLLGFAGLGARRYPALAWMAGANFAFHSAIAHKEYRFILLSVAAVVILAAIGTIDWIESVRRKDGEAAAEKNLRLITLVWLIASISSALGPFRTQWMLDRPEMRFYAQLRRDPAFCGLALYRHHFTETGGYTYLHRGTPMLYMPPQDDTANATADLASAARAVNVVMTTPDHAAELPGAFHESECDGRGAERVCLYRRPGACTAAPETLKISAALARVGD